MAKKPEPRGRGRPTAASTSKPVKVDGRTNTGKRLAAIEKALQSTTLGEAGQAATIAVKMEVANLHLQRWTLLSVDPSLNLREQTEASRQAAVWTHEFRQLSQRQADDLIRELATRMHEQEEAADRLERL